MRKSHFDRRLFFRQSESIYIQIIDIVMEKANGQSGPWKYVVLVAGFVNLALCFGLLGSIGVLIVEWREYYDIGAAAASSITIGLYVLPPIICKYYKINVGVLKDLSHLPAITLRSHCDLKSVKA